MRPVLDGAVEPCRPLSGRHCRKQLGNHSGSCAEPLWLTPTSSSPDVFCSRACSRPAWPVPPAHCTNLSRTGFLGRRQMHGFLHGGDARYRGGWRSGAPCRKGRFSAPGCRTAVACSAAVSRLTSSSLSPTSARSASSLHSRQATGFRCHPGLQLRYQLDPPYQLRHRPPAPPVGRQPIRAGGHPPRLCTLSTPVHMGRRSLRRRTLRHRPHRATRHQRPSGYPHHPTGTVRRRPRLSRYDIRAGLLHQIGG
jgi:hypothetical protein